MDSDNLIHSQDRSFKQQGIARRQSLGNFQSYGAWYVRSDRYFSIHRLPSQLMLFSEVGSYPEPASMPFVVNPQSGFITLFPENQIAYAPGHA